MIKESISVIIPTFNSSHTIHRAIDSVLKQTYRPNEIIVIDDASTDGTISIVEKIIESNRHASIKLLRNSKNSGPSISRNKGIEISEGEWIAFLDSDDSWHPQKLQIQLELAQEHECCFIGTLFGIQTSFTPISRQKPIMVKTLTKSSFLWKNYFSTPTVLIKKNSLLLFNSEMKYAEDFDLWTKMIHHLEKAILIQENLVSLGSPPFMGEGLSSKLFQMERGELKVLRNERQISLRFLAMAFSLLKFSRRLIIKFFSLL